MRKRLISTLTCVSMLLGVFSSSLAYAESDSKIESTDSNVAYAVFGDNVESQGFKDIKVGPVKNTKNVSERLGRKAWTLKKTDGFDSDRICLTFTDEFKAGAKTGDAYEITVDWYDEGNGGYFYIGYDGYYRGEKVEHNRTEEIYTEGDNAWKTATFYIDDAQFAETLAGDCDMFIGTQLFDYGWTGAGRVISSVNITVGKITIKKTVSKNPVRVHMDAEAPAHAFPWYGEKIIHNKLVNTTDREITATVNFKPTDEDGYCPYTVTKELTFAPGEEKNLDTDFSEMEYCGIFDYVVEVIPDDGSFSEKVTRDGFVVLKTDPDGIKNNSFYYATHLPSFGYPQENQDVGWYVLELGNASGLRNDNGWFHSETRPGEYSIDYTEHRLAQDVKERGMNFMPIMWLSNANYQGGRQYLPDTDGEWALAEKWLDWWMPRVKDVYNEYEYWNEPLFTSAFCVNYNTDDYLRGYRLLLEKVKQYDPGTPVAALSYTDLGSGSRQAEFEKLLKLGIAEDLRGNAISLHGYTRTIPEGSLPIAGVKWYTDKLKEYGVERNEYEMWNSEFGYTIADPIDFKDNKAQGAMVTRSVLEYVENNSFDKYVVYKFENDGNVKVSREASFGHVSNPHDCSRVWGEVCVPTESYLMTTTLNYMMPDAKLKTAVIDDSNLKVRRFSSGKFNKDFLELNAVSGSELFSMDLGCKNVTYFDEYGNETELYSEDGVYTFNATEYPKYVLGNFTKAVRVDTNKVSGNLEAEVAEDDIFEVTLKEEQGKNYTLEVQDTGTLSVVSNTGFVNGTATVRIKSTAAYGETYKIVFIVKDGDNIVSKLDVYAEVVEKALPNLALSIASMTNLNKWNGIATVKNTSGTDCISGKLRILSPDEFVTKEPISIGYVPAGKTTEVTFPLPDINKKGIEYISYQIELDSGEIIKNSIRVDTSVADYAHTKPKIDGEMQPGEWNLGTAMVTDTADDLVYVDNWKGSMWKGPQDQSAKCYVAWDEEKLYLCWDVTDDVFSQENEGTNVWAGDNVQLGVYYGTNDEFVAAGQASMAFNEIGISLTKNGPEMYRWSSQGDDNPPGLVDPSRYELGITRNGNKTVYEWAVPWGTVLSGDKYPGEGDKLGFAFVINENDGEGRRGAMRYADGIFFSKDTTQFSYINLIKSEVQN